MLNNHSLMDAADDAKVQHVTKKSSDELLRKFAELGEEEPQKRDLRVSKRLKKSRGTARREDQCGTPSGAAAVVERRSLLPPGVSRSSVLLRQIRGRGEIRNRSLLGTIQKTWRRTVEGASRVFIEKHYHRHKRLISDIV